VHFQHLLVPGSLLELIDCLASAALGELVRVPLPALVSDRGLHREEPEVGQHNDNEYGREQRVVCGVVLGRGLEYTTGQVKQQKLALAEQMQAIVALAQVRLEHCDGDLTFKVRQENPETTEKLTACVAKLCRDGNCITIRDCQHWMLQSKSFYADCIEGKPLKSTWSRVRADPELVNESDEDQIVEVNEVNEPVIMSSERKS
jgi:hypothetical protein